MSTDVLKFSKFVFGAPGYTCVPCTFSQVASAEGGFGVHGVKIQANWSIPWRMLRLLRLCDQTVFTILIVAKCHVSIGESRDVGNLMCLREIMGINADALNTGDWHVVGKGVK